jgi:polysaccharide biosynthesis PFTS motif protein
MKKFIKRFYKRRLCWVLRGHRELKKTGSEGKIYDVMHDVTSTMFSPSNNYSKRIFGTAVNEAELITRQYLLARTIVGVRFSKSLLYTCKKPKAWVTGPLPPEWRRVVRQHGFKIPKVWGSLIWNSYVLFYFAAGVLTICKITLDSIKAIYVHSKPRLENFVYFVGLTKNNTPENLQGEHSYDIISWYCQWSGRVKNINALCHDVKDLNPCAVAGIPVVRMPSGIPPLAKCGTLMRYISWSLMAIGFCMIELLRGRWWHALLLGEASRSTAVRMQCSKQLARDYLFHNSSWVYRPLWTYEAAKKGSRITFYFYSTNCEGFKRPNGNYPRPHVGYLMMNWPHYLVWNNHQANTIRRWVSERPIVSVVGPIWFHSGGVKLPALSSKAIAVFDVQPIRDSFYKSLGLEFDYYTPTTAIQFLSDIQVALTRCGNQFVFKRKRNIGRLGHPKYVQFIKKSTERPDFVEVDPDTSAVQVIKNCVAVISMPFTSTALIAKELGKPSVYYDPHGLIQKDDRGAHGIDILCGPKELAAWVSSIGNVETLNETPPGAIIN